jgi:glycosyltransferase involved in cell wall biosynthesis
VQVIHVNEIASVSSGLVRGLRAAGVEAELIDPPKPGAAVAYPWKAATIPLRLAIQAAVAARLRLRRPDLVHVHYASQSAIGWLSGRRFVVHCHGTDVRGAVPSAGWGRALAPGLRRADAVMYSTPDLGPTVRAFRPDAELLPNPVDTDQFTPGAPPTRDVLVAVRLDPTKGAAEVMGGLRRLLVQRPETTATVIAFGAQAGQLTADLGPNVRLLAVVPHEAMPRLIQDHRTAIGQLAFGSIGVSELEILAAGVPVVADFRYHDVYPEPAPILQAASADEVARGLLEVLEGRLPAGADRAARAWVVRYHGIPAVTDRLLRTYRRILSLGGA